MCPRSRSQLRHRAGLLIALAVVLPACAADPSLAPEQLAAVERAQRALSERYPSSNAGDAQQYTVAAIEAKEWSDSSLGCRSPGTMYQPVVTSGYVVLLQSGEQTHEVHVAGERTVICPSVSRSGVRQPPLRARATNLARLEGLAREDLASKLGVPADAVRVTQRVPKQWTPSALECRQPPAAEDAHMMMGFKLFLIHQGRTYTYHTDESRVFACPEIAAK